MKVLISGSHGLVGAALVERLSARGHSVVRLVRAPGQGAIAWDPRASAIDAGPFEGFDAVVHLAGESIDAGRWTSAKKERLRASRVPPTESLSSLLARLSRPPTVFACASAIGYYGDRGVEVLTEKSSPGKDFLSALCREWERSTGPAAEKGLRVVNLRFGIILSPKGGALQKMLTPFKLGAGGKLGDGRQYMSWIALDDAVGAIDEALTNAALKGPVNVVAPEAATNAEFTKALASVLKRPAFFPVPAFMARLAFGEMADALLLSSTRVVPEKLVNAGYKFGYPSLKGALAHVLGK